MPFKGRQLLTYTTLYLSYTLYVYVRRSFSYVIPVLAVEEGIDKSQLGLITSSHTLAYTISKFVCGILVDFFSPRILLSAGLIVSGLSASCFTGTDSILMMSVWWFINGLAQGPGWPTIAIILRRLCPVNQFGTVWSIISSSMNLAGTIGPIATAFLVRILGWRICIQIAGTSSVLFGFVALALIKDRPEMPQTEETKSTTNSTSKNDSKQQKATISRKEILFIPGFQGVCLCYMVTALVQHGLLQWAQLFLIEERGQTLLTGSAFLSSLDIGGIVGSFAAGFLSDYMISKNPSIPRYIVRRTLVLYFAIALCILMFVFTASIQQTSYQVVIASIGFALGFSIYGPISMFGVIAMEIAPESMAGTSHAIAATFSNVGIMTAGLPLSYTAKLYDLHTAFLIVSTILIAMVTYLLIKSKKDLASYDNKSKHLLLF